jgi:hypothetical protein
MAIVVSREAGMYRIFFWATLSLVGCTSAVAKDEGFSGTWVLDTKSPQPANAPNKLKTKIKQKGSHVTIESTFDEPAGGVLPLLYMGVLAKSVKLDGNGHPQKHAIGPFHFQTKTTIPGNQMLTEWIAAMHGSQVEGHWTHTLTDPGRFTLEIQERPSPDKEEKATLYFVRK